MVMYHNLDIIINSVFFPHIQVISAQKDANALHYKWVGIRSSLLSSDNMRILKWPLSPYKDKWHRAYNELQAMRTLKKKVSEVNPKANFVAIMNDSFHNYGTDPSPSAYSFMIKYLSHKRLFSHLHLILDHLEKAERLEIPERIFANLIQYYGKLSLLQDAIDTFYRIPKFRCTPSVLSLNSLLSVLCKKEEGLILVRDVLMKSLEMRIRLEASTFRILIRALCRNGKVSSAVELLNLMQLDECTPDSKMYSQVLNSLCKHGEVSEVMDFLEVMGSAGILPDTSDYNSVIDFLVRAGKGDYAYSVLTKMKSEDKRPDISSYNSVLNGLLLKNDFLKVDEMFDEILLTGLAPNVSTYNTYVDGLCRQGDFKRANRMVICMEKAGCMPDSTTFNVLISGYVKAGEMGKAREIMNEMLLRVSSGTHILMRV